MPHASANDPRTALMLRVADLAGEIALRHFQSAELSVDTKSDQSPVTVADREIESMIRAEVSRAFPNDAILGEEHGETAGSSGFRWVIDPIDGTISFATGVPLFGTLIGIERTIESAIISGVCAMPALGERVWAARGAGAWWERRDAVGTLTQSPARVRPCASLAQALVCTTGLEYFERARATDALVAVARTAGRVRGWSDCYGGMLVATGRADAWFDPVMNPWDSGPFPVILSEAGGVFTDFRGKPDFRGGSAVAGSSAIHAELLRVIQASASHAPSNANS